MATCRGCGATIVWVKTRNGKQTPCDPERLIIKRRDPLFDGERPVSTVQTEDGETVAGVIHLEGDDPDALVVGRRSHWATCPAPIPGTARKRITEIEEAADEYAEARDARQAATSEEVDKKTELLRVLKKHGFKIGDVYELDEERVVFIEAEEETVRVRPKKKPKADKAA